MGKSWENPSIHPFVVLQSPVGCATQKAPELPCIFGIEQVWGLGEVTQDHSIKAWIYSLYCLGCKQDEFDLVGFASKSKELHPVFRIDALLQSVEAISCEVCWVIRLGLSLAELVLGVRALRKWGWLRVRTGGCEKVAEQFEITKDNLQLRDPDLYSCKQIEPLIFL